MAIPTPALRAAAIASTIVGAGALVVVDQIETTGAARAILAISVTALLVAVGCAVVLARRAKRAL